MRRIRRRIQLWPAMTRFPGPSWTFWLWFLPGLLLLRSSTFLWILGTFVFYKEEEEETVRNEKKNWENALVGNATSFQTGHTRFQFQDFISSLIKQRFQ